MKRLLTLGATALLLALVAPACEEKKRNATPVDQTASITVVSAADGGQSVNTMMIGNTDAFPLPIGDQPAVGRQPEMRAPGVYVVRLADGFSRTAYLGTASLFFGPRLAPDAPTSPATFLAGAVTGWEDPALRSKILQVARERARGELPELLVAVADHPGPEWREAFLALPEEERAMVRRELTPVLAGVRPERLLAAALALDLSAHTEAVALRVAELGSTGDHVVTAILLSALPAGKVRAALACRMLAESTTLPHGDPLLSAALLALNAKDVACLELVRKLVSRDACAPDAWCTESTESTESTPSASQPGERDEAVCSRDESQRSADQESRRSKWDVVATPAAPTTRLAMAVLYSAQATPATLRSTCQRTTAR